MRDNWNRATPVIDLSQKDVLRLVKMSIPMEGGVRFEPTSGGLANTNLKVTSELLGIAFLLRLWTREPSAASKEFRIFQLLGTQVPIPRLIHFSTENPINGSPFMLMEWVKGVRLETVVDALSDEDVAVLGAELGSTLAAIHHFQFEHAGFFDGNLEIATPIKMNGSGLLQYAQECLLKNGGRERIGESLTDETLAFIEKENHILDEWTGKPCLTHGDFNGSNILVKNEAEGWKVAAVLDWEFAFCGTPFFDLGNLLRPPLGLLAGIEEAVARGYKNGGGDLPADWRRMSTLTDLTAWLEFLTRENAGPQLISDCKSQISKTISEW